MAQSALKVFSILVVALALNACQWSNSNQSNVLVVAIEGLDFESMSCLPDLTETYVGFAEFCRDSVRFTHAYTPSVMSQAALASVLTGRYPIDHGVRQNGSHYLKEDFETVAEVALRNGYRTSFFSGGAPILRKSGFSQGFEYFDDNVSLSLSRYYRPANESFNNFWGWYDSFSFGKGFFSIVYLNDLLYYIIPTRNELGVERSLTKESQLRAIDLALQNLVKELKSRKLWHRTHVLLVGLNGHLNRARPKELPTTNLYSESTQVALMIKPASRDRDEGASWSIDANVSLVDVGLTLFALVGEVDFVPAKSEFEPVLLTGALERPKVTWKKDRPIMSETGWADWREVSGIRYAVRRENWFYLYGNPDYYFNTLIDRSELSSVKFLGEPELTDAKSLRKLLVHENDVAWSEPAEQLVGKLRLGQRWSEFEDLSKEEELALRGLLKESPWDKEILSWLWRTYLKREDWDNLESLLRPDLEPIWSVALSKYLRKEIPKKNNRDVCVNIFDPQISAETISKCKYELVRYFGFWLATAGTSEEQRATNRFIKLYYYKLIDSSIRRLNYLNGTIFDSEIRNDLEVELIDLVLRLPEFKKQRALVTATIDRLNAGEVSDE